MTREPVLVGGAAASFTVSGYLEDPPHWPDVEEARAFVRDYERARERRFDAGERRAVAAATLYAVAYKARCEHALGRGGDARRLGSFERAFHAEALA